MVVGAGIAGIQASLDLAESGYLVYLVEKSPAIGGTMPMLDKTFPTNDCSMCILSPKLVECGRHRNIKIFSSTDIEAFSGQPGNFKVRLREHARYVNTEKCTSCGECAKACPVERPNTFDAGLGKRKAAYKLYPQAMPAAFSLEKKGTPPCRAACPAGVNAQGYVQLVKAGKLPEAWKIVYRDNPLPAVCGRVCTHPCESKCYRGTVDEPVAIRQLKRLITDVLYKDPAQLPLPVPEVQRDERVAVVGSGPAGLSAAYQLAVRGYKVTVLEAKDKLGGMLRYGIPSYRLPREWLDLEIGLLEKLGVEFKTNTPLGPKLTVSDLLSQGYSSVFLGLGAWKGTSTGVSGEDLEGVLVGVDFLVKVNAGENVRVGSRVAVIGGGNTAMDAARIALRQGAKEVTIVYRRTEAEITAAQEEIQEAREEGINFLMLTSPKAVHGENGKLTGLECLRNELGAPDESGRRRPVPIPGSEFFMELDTLIMAVGQVPDTGCTDGMGLTTGRGGRIVVDQATLATSLPGVFAGGDTVTGAATVIEAIAAGKNAAESIDLYIQGLDLKEGRLNQDQEIAPQPDLLPSDSGQGRPHAVHVNPEKRISSFEEVASGLSLEEGQSEAERCLNCGACSECLECVKACLPGAVDHSQTDNLIEIEVGAVLLNPGAEIYNPEALSYYGYKKFPNVLTSIEFERVLSASGPFMGHLVRPFDHREPKRIAWIQCVGSRNIREEKGYCSGVCCMYAIKEAVIAKEHSQQGLDTTIFYMDMRTYGKGFENYYESAKEKGVSFVRSRIFNIEEKEDDSKNLIIRYADEIGAIHHEEFDMVVLSVALTPSAGAVELAGELGLELNHYHFCQPADLTGVGTNRPGIYVAGTFAAPKDIPETVMQASAAAGESARLLTDVRGTLVTEKEFPPERDIAGEESRIGVFVCNCGINIGGVVRVPEVVEMAEKLPNVVYSGEYLYVCSQDSQSKMKELIDEHKLNRVVVASCSPRTHRPLFQETLREAGLNRYLFEMANIRDQCSWVHQKEPDKATAKAKDLVRMVVAKSPLLEQVTQSTSAVIKEVLVIGGGVAGMTNALSLADMGFKVNLLEKNEVLGGLANRIDLGLNGEDVKSFIADLAKNVENHSNVKLYAGAEVKEVSGYVGNFSTRLTTGDEIKHSVTVIATGGAEYKPVEYLYGQNDRVMTQLEIGEALSAGDPVVTGAKNVVFIQCVGSREPGRMYCSRVCCAKSIKLALRLKSLNPDTNVFILYRDIRTYGFYEDLYREARARGVIFVRYSIDNKPVVEAGEDGLTVTVTDHVLGQPLEIKADVVGLAAAIIAQDSNKKLSQLFKLPINEDGFFLEAHMKLRPVDFASEGIYMAGLAHGPKTIDENVSQAKAAAGRALTILSKDHLESHGVVAVVQQDKCAACLTCVRLCPYGAPKITNYAAEIESVVCQGCGTCAGECPNKAITLQHYKDPMQMAQCDALFKEVH